MNIRDEYKLSPTSLPPLYQLKAAHHSLLQGYVEALSAVSRLSFLVRLNEFKAPTQSKSRNTIRSIVSGEFSPLRIFVWRPLVKLYTEAHIHKRLKELITIYAQAKHLEHPNYSDGIEYQSWWKEAREDCEQLAATLSSGELFYSTLKVILVAIVNFLVVAWGANNLSDLGLRILSLEAPTRAVEFIVKLIIFTILAFPLIVIFFESAFTTKREIFLASPAEPKQTNSIYQLENNLFDFLARGKSREVPIDFLVSSFFYLSSIAYMWFLGRLAAITVQSGQGRIYSINYFACSIVPILALFITNVVIPWHRRDMEREA